MASRIVTLPRLLALFAVAALAVFAVVWVNYPNLHLPGEAQPVPVEVLLDEARKGRVPEGAADRQRLLARLANDLTGREPTPEEVEGFLHDHSPEAFEKLVQQLTSPQRDADRNSTIAYRDYVVRALNGDLPYDHVTRGQLADDLLASPKPTPEARALAYLAVEVPPWYAENKCFSCHNNGDAVRALFAGIQAGHKVPPAAIADTARWLTSPGKWEDNRGDPRFSDRNLARLQFGHALLSAVDTELVKAPESLSKAAALIAEHQNKDGFWQIDADGPGSPATYGSALATLTARRILHRADAKKFHLAIERADAWLHRLPVRSVGNAAVLLRALRGVEGDEAHQQRSECVKLLEKAQDREGGWGPYVQSPPEVFDTALVVLALVETGDAKHGDMVRRGRAYLLATQREDGSWAETVRAPEAWSYAQKISTTGWATLALLATADQTP